MTFLPAAVKCRPSIGELPNKRRFRLHKLREWRHRYAEGCRNYLSLSWVGVVVAEATGVDEAALGVGVALGGVSPIASLKL